MVNRSDRELDALFADYRVAAEVPEPGPSFMPRLWDRIEKRRSFAFQWKRVTQVFVGSAAVICLLLTGIMVVPRTAAAPSHATYLDVLAEAHPTENLAAQGIARFDNPEASR